MKRADEAPEPSIEVDVDRKYVVELVALEEGPSQWPDAKPGDVSLTWKYRMFDQTSNEPVIDANTGYAYELWQFSNDKTYRNVKSGKAAKAREWAEALLGRELSDEQVNELIDYGFGEALKGKKALADVEWYTTTKGYERLKIIRLRPFRKQPAAARPVADLSADLPPAVQFTPDGAEVRESVAAAIAPAPVTAAADRAATRKRLGLDDAA